MYLPAKDYGDPVPRWEKCAVHAHLSAFCCHPSALHEKIFLCWRYLVKKFQPAGNGSPLLQWSATKNGSFESVQNITFDHREQV